MKAPVWEKHECCFWETCFPRVPDIDGAIGSRLRDICGRLACEAARFLLQVDLYKQQLKAWLIYLQGELWSHVFGLRVFVFRMFCLLASGTVETAAECSGAPTAVQCSDFPVMSELVADFLSPSTLMHAALSVRFKKGLAKVLRPLRRSPP